MVARPVLLPYLAVGRGWLAGLCSSSFLSPGPRKRPVRTFLRSYRGTHPLGRSALSLLRCGEHPRGYPDVASGRCTGTLRQRGQERLAERRPERPTGKRGRTVSQRGKAVSSVVTSGCPSLRGRVPCRNEDDNRLSKRKPLKAVSLVSRLLPGLTPADLHIQRNAQASGTAHLLDEHTFGGFTLTGGNLENDFVVNLQQHAGLQTLLA